MIVNINIIQIKNVPSHNDVKDINNDIDMFQVRICFAMYIFWKINKYLKSGDMPMCKQC